MRSRPRLFPAAAAAAGLLCAAFAAWAQYAVRPDDPLGLSIRERRVRVIHASTPDVPGTSMHLQQTDPWLAYQRGRSYYFREWGVEDGAFLRLPPRTEAASGTSCGMCHNLPFPSVGAGGNVAIPVGVGRAAPHFFGAGLLETAGLQIRQEILNRFDANRNGYLDVPAETEGRRATVEASPGVELDLGSLHDDNGDGRPDLNPMFMVRVVDGQGRRHLTNDQGRLALLKDPGIVGYDLLVGVFASSAGDHQFPSMRSFSTGVYNTINGILLDVPVVAAHPRFGGFWIEQWGKVSNAGSLQSEIFLSGDPAALDASGRGKITEGELDLLEWFMMNHPAPAQAVQTERTRRGRALLAEYGCTSCHVGSWVIKPADEATRMPGDRRFFHLAVAPDPASGELRGRLIDLTKEVRREDGTVLRVPRREGFVVEDVFTDLRHHDLGEKFYEYNYRNGQLTVAKRFRTTPLWGVGSTAPYGHDGRSATLDDVVRRHGGDAEASVRAYAKAPAEDREALIAFLRSLVLYTPELLPTDLDGDGRIDPSWKARGEDLGPEIFRAELLFRTRPRYRGWVEGPEGDRYFSYEMLNVAEAYGETLEALADKDRNGIPDVAETRTAGTKPQEGGTAAPGPAGAGSSYSGASAEPSGSGPGGRR
jgi:cytochrome c peroxidase